MKKSSGKGLQAKGRKTKDAQAADFERRDLGADIRAAGVTRLLRRPTRPTSILLDQDLVQQLRMKAVKQRVGYQTMLKIIVREHLDEG